MQLIEFGEQLNTPIVICLGYFGCMHSGHVKLLEVAKIRAREQDAKVALFTFNNNHLRVLGKDAKVVYTFEERLVLYDNLDVDYVISATFNDEFRSNTGEQFIEQLKHYNLKGVVCGFDYCCGSDRLNCNQVKSRLSVVCDVDIVDAICRNGEKISTTSVRQLLENSDIASVNELLSEPYFLVGKVEHGRHVGRDIGFPTANLKLSSEKLLPIGVYCGQTVIGGKSYKVIVNIGQKPTFGLDYVNVEAHIVNFDGDLYGSTIKISLTKFLRPIRKFDSAGELVEQLKKDREVTLYD